MAKVTIAMPVYNVANYIKDSLISALNQTFDDLEILVVDDKGQDNSIEIVKEIQKTHPRGGIIRIIDHITNKGTGGTKNTAMKEANSDYLYFMDSDDTIREDTIQLLYDKIIETGADIVAASYQIVMGDRITSKEVLPKKAISSDCAIADWMQETKLYFNLFTWNKLYNLSFLRNNKVYCIPHHRNEDTLFTFQVALFAKSIVTLDAVTYNYYMRPGSTVHQGLSEFYYNQYIEIMKERIKIVADNGLNLSPVLNNYILEPFFEYFIYIVLNSDFSQSKKENFYHEMQNVFTIGINKDNVIGRRYRKMVTLLSKDNYQALYAYLHKEIKFKNIYRKLKKIGIVRLPYNHL